MINSKKKNMWRERWLRSVNELTSLELQRKSWLDKTHTNPHWSFIEFMCCYFDDLVIDDKYKYQLDKGWISNLEYELIEDWHIELDNYNAPNNDDYDNEAILNDPKWLEILEIGIKAKVELAKTLDETERDFLTKEADYLKTI